MVESVCYQMTAADVRLLGESMGHLVGVLILAMLLVNLDLDAWEYRIRRFLRVRRIRAIRAVRHGC